MSLRTWGNYPQIENKRYLFENASDLKEIFKGKSSLIPYGNGRCYGDSALNSCLVHTRKFSHFIDFDEISGILTVQSGVLLSEILEIVVPKGWFLKVSPGTKLITIGGAIASDVHGKNHHKVGCFSECIQYFNLMLPNGEVIKCSKFDNIELFRATCGGMGLTGVILEVQLTLKRINSSLIDQTVIKTKNLKETFESFEENKDADYSVAWIDCLSSRSSLGRSHLMLGEFCPEGGLLLKKSKTQKIPFNFPRFSLNSLSVRAFNFLYYQRVQSKIKRSIIPYEKFFYPLDSLLNWNKIYGKNGFTQYQFILPKKASYEGLIKILKKISQSGKGSFLAVLKLYGPSNENYLSFPLEGYSLALDFKIEPGLFPLLNHLDKIVLEYGGRVYLAKDVRMNREVFERSYPNINKFRKIREKYSLKETLNSLQSIRIGI